MPKDNIVTKSFGARRSVIMPRRVAAAAAALYTIIVPIYVC